MTDTLSGSNTGATGAVPNDAPTTPLSDALPPSDGDRPVEWAPAEPPQKKRRLGLWIGIGAGILLLAAGAASVVLIAPGTKVAGIDVGGMTPGMAAAAIDAKLAGTEVRLTGAGDDVVVTGADLGAQLDATAAAEQAFAERPMWQVGNWMGEPLAADITLDPEAADRALRAAVPNSFVDAVDATVTFDPKSNTYTTTPAESGTGIDLTALTDAFATGIAEGESAVEFSAAPTETAAQIGTDEATATAEQLNGMLSKIGFYVGKERTVPITPAVAATWLSVQPVDGELTIEADQAAIQKVVDTLPKAINRAAVDATNIVDSNGTVLHEQTAGVEGRALGDTSNAASDFAARLADGNPVYELAVTTTPFETTELFRRIEVDLSEQRVYLFENEKAVQSWSVSTGLDANPTTEGRFKVFAKVRIQDMGNPDTTKPPYFFTPDVPYVSYFNGDQALHGTWWHNNFGQQMSHGCVNMPIPAAKFVYEWAPIGLEVWVHS